MNIIQSFFSYFSGKPVRKFALKQDKPDSRDWHVNDLLCTLKAAPEPTSGSVYDSRIVVKDQGSTGSCAGQSGANGMRAAYLALGLDCPDLSAMFAYYGARALEGCTGEDNGVYLRDIIKTFQDVGECPEANWPFAERKVLTAPTWSAFKAAIARRGIRGYYRIPTGMSTTVPTVKKLIANKIPVVGGWQVDNSIMDETKLTPQDACKPPYVGGHAMLIESFEGDIFTLLNSWGKGYRKGGRFLATRGFLAAGNDLWALDVRKT